jgi:ATP-binding cassette subfamily C protein
MPIFSGHSDIARKVYDLAKPYSRRKLALVFVVILMQGFLQVAGVTSIFPFLALASDPERFRESGLGRQIFSLLPGWTDRSLLIASGIVSVAVLLVSNVFLLVSGLVISRFSFGLGHWLRVRLISRMASNPYSYFLNRNTGELLKKTISDVNQFVNSILLPLLSSISTAVTVVLLLATLLWVEWRVALAAGLGLGAFYAVIYHLLGSRRNHHSNLIKAASRGSVREAQQLLGGIKPIKIHQCEETFIGRYSAHSATLADLMKWLPIYQNSPRYLIEPLAFGGIVLTVVVFAAGGRDFASILPKLGVMAFAGYRLLPNLQTLYGCLSSITMNRHAVEEVHEEFEESRALKHTVIRRKTAAVTVPLQWQKSIRIEEMSFAYPGMTRPLFDQLNLEITKNQFVAFAGETGSGKSTFVDLLLGLHHADQGRFTIDGNPLGDETMGAWRASLGYVPQEIFLLDDSIEANIALGVRAENLDPARIREVARIAQIAAFIENELPDGYRTRVGERGVRLSGGQRQRIGLARALYHRPTTLVLDEATSALDNETETALMRAIESLHREMTLIVIAHRLSTIHKADRIFVLEKGRLARQGTFEELYGQVPSTVGAEI